MAYCSNCGKELDEGANFCSGCGTQQGEQRQNYGGASSGGGFDPQQAYSQFTNTPDSSGDFDAVDVATYKGICVLCYLGLFLLIPLLLYKDSPYVRYHANQGLVLLVFSVVISVVAVIPILGWIITIVGTIFTVVLLIIGMINTLNGNCKELPLIGRFRILP